MGRFLTNPTSLLSIATKETSRKVCSFEKELYLCNTKMNTRQTHITKKEHMKINGKELKYWSNYLIRYYSDSTQRSVHSLIGMRTFCELLEDDEQLRDKILNRVESNDDVTTRIRLRRGVEFVFRYR